VAIINNKRPKKSARKSHLKLNCEPGKHKPSNRYHF